MKNRPTFLKELGELRLIFIRFAVLLFILAFILLSTSFAWTNWTVFGTTKIPVLVFGTPSLSTQLFTLMKAYLVPEGVSIITLGPLALFLAPISVAFMVAFILSFPYFLFSLARYIAPALYERERRHLFVLFFSSVALFFFGCIFAQAILIPYTLTTLYSFAGPLGVAPLFSLDVFIGMIFGLTISSGIAFLAPIVMILLSSAGFVPAAFWRVHWRASAVLVLAFSAIITPDGSGVTMVILSVPLMFLYGVGAVGSFIYSKGNYY